MNFKPPETCNEMVYEYIVIFLSAEEKDPAVLYHSKVAKWNRTSERKLLKCRGKGK